MLAWGEEEPRSREGDAPATAAHSALEGFGVPGSSRLRILTFQGGGGGASGFRV